VVDGGRCDYAAMGAGAAGSSTFADSSVLTGSSTLATSGAAGVAVARQNLLDLIHIKDSLHSSVLAGSVAGAATGSVGFVSAIQHLSSA